MLCYIILYYVMLCYAMMCYVDFSKSYLCTFGCGAYVSIVILNAATFLNTSGSNLKQIIIIMKIFIQGNLFST